MQASIISIVWLMMCFAPRPSKRSTADRRHATAAAFMKADRESRSSAAAQNGS